MVVRSLGREERKESLEAAPPARACAETERARAANSARVFAPCRSTQPRRRRRAPLSLTTSLFLPCFCLSLGAAARRALVGTTAGLAARESQAPRSRPGGLWRAANVRSLCCAECSQPPSFLSFFFSSSSSSCNHSTCFFLAVTVMVLLGPRTFQKQWRLCARARACMWRRGVPAAAAAGVDVRTHKTLRRDTSPSQFQLPRHLLLDIFAATYARCLRFGMS